MTQCVAFVTGASRGIGRGIALELASHGFDIVGAATSADPSNHDKGLFEVKDRVEELGQKFLDVTGDIGNLEEHGAMINRALDAFGHIDVLVNNAGVAPLERVDMLESTAESFDRVLNINLRGPYFFSQAVAKHMINQVNKDAAQSPVMIFITSVSANTASPDRVEYCVSKAGLSMVAQAFAVRLAAQGINVYEIRPGIIETDMTATVKDKYDERIAEGLLLQERWGEPKDVAKAVAALALGYFPYSTGAVIDVGGGLDVRRL